MERLTIPDVRIDQNTIRRSIIDAEKVKECAMEIYWRLKSIEDAVADAESEEYDLDRLRELLNADRAGRCVVSPVAVGQMVWFVRDPKRHPENITQTTVQKIVFKRGGAYMKLECNSLYETSCNSIGKTVFLTREAAEAALKGEQDG